MDSPQRDEPSPAERVRETARLARLELSGDEVERLGGELQQILTAFDALSGAEVEGVAPMSGPHEEVDVLRDDRARTPGEGLERDALLREAPQREGEFFGVPKTVGGAG